MNLNEALIGSRTAGGRPDSPFQSCLTCVQQIADSYHGRIAAEDGQGSVDYQTLFARSKEIALALAERDVKEGDIVILRCARNADYLAAMLGTWRVGAAFLPVDPATPSARFQYIVEHARARAILCDEIIGESNSAEILISNCVTTTGDITLPALEEDPARLAYVVFTSGSTGYPKGVEIEHGSLRLLVDWHIATFGLSARDRVSQLASIGFDAAIWEVWPALCAGACVCFATDERKRHLGELCDWFEDAPIDIAWLPTPLTEALFQLAPARLAALALPRVITTAGDQLKKFKPAEITSRVFNCYGPSEDTVCSTYAEVETRNPASTRPPPIGRPIAGKHIEIVDEGLRPLKQGDVGEIAISGHGLARGYLHDETQTKQRFVYSDAARRFYRTGDLGYFDEQGQLHFVGRNDSQINRHGFRVELGEIEASLVRLNGVSNAVVVLNSGNQLVAFLESKNRNFDSLEFVLGALGESVPDYMFPDICLRFSVFPVTERGKIDKNTLIDSMNEGGATPAISFETPLQGRIHEIVTEVLTQESVSPEVGFFMAGGNSIAAMRVISALEAEFNVRIPLKAFMANNSVLEIEALVSELRNREDNQSIAVVPSGSSLERASMAQELVWFLTRVEDSNKAYHAKALCIFEGSIDIQALRGALQHIVSKHGIYRTSFIERDDTPYQKVHDECLIKVPTIDCANIPRHEAVDHAVKYLNGDINRPFELAELPLVRWAILRYQEDFSILAHVEHHIVHDGWSYNLFLSDLNNSYSDLIAGRRLVQESAPFQFIDFSKVQREWAESADTARQVAYWKKKLEGSSPLLSLPTKAGRKASRFEGGGKRVCFERARWMEIESAAARFDATPFMFLLSVFSVVLGRFAGQSDVSIGSGFANRNWRNSEEVVGMVINTVVLRSRLDPALSFAELLTDVRQTVLDAFDHQDLPFERVVRAVNPARVIGANPLFQAFFGFHDAPMPELSMPGLRTRIYEALGSGASKFDLSLVVIPREGQIGKSDPVHLVWEYNSHLFSDQFIDEIISSFEILLENVLRRPGENIYELPLHSDERLTKLVTLRMTEKEQLPDSMAVANMVRRASELSPDKIAVRCEQHSVSYRGLETFSNQIANQLIELGFGAGDLIAVGLPRSVELVATLVAIEKIGGAYLPIDPQYPKSRRDFILNHSKAKCLLSRGVSEESSCRAIDLNEYGDSVGQQSESYERIACDGDALAYVIYTSGSTGHPKGVAVSRRAFQSFSDAVSSRVGINSDTRILAITSLSFDIAALELLVPLMRGATITIATDEDVHSGERIARLISAHDINMFQATPSSWKILLEDKSWVPEAGFTGLCGGEALTSGLAQEILERGIGLFNMYGPTEATVWATCAQITAENVKKPPIGYALSNTEIFVLDQNMKPVPQGVDGQLWIGGAGLAEGYLHQDELTGERFKDVYLFDRLRRIYATGDLVRFGEHGELHFLRRLDNQIKLRGFRIEIEEIEHVLERHAGVMGAVVRLHEQPNDSILVAFVASEVHADELKRYCSAELPQFMVPQRFVRMKKLPLTPNGKIDRNALLLPQTLDARSKRILPRNKMEHCIFEKYRAYLSEKTFGIEDDFFWLGGSSLTATRIIGQLNRELGINLGIRDFFEFPTVEKLSLFLASVMGDEEKPVQAEEDFEDIEL